MRLRFLILCVLSLAIQTLTAQVEHSILDSRLVWRYSFSAGSSAPELDNRDMRIDTIETLFNGKKFFHYQQHWGESMLIAEDTALHQVWVYSPLADTVVKIIDFEASIGDTLDLSALGNYVSKAVVMDTLDSIQLANGETRSSIEILLFNGEYQDRTIFWVDGIGSTEGIDYFNTYSALPIRLLSCVFNESPSFENLYGNCALSVSELSDVSFQLSVWPNPAKDVLNMEADSPMEEIRVYDHLGSLVGSWQYAVGSASTPFDSAQGPPLSTQYTIDVSSFKPGLYFLMVKTEKGVETKKVIIER